MFRPSYRSVVGAIVTALVSGPVVTVLFFLHALAFDRNTGFDPDAFNTLLILLPYAAGVGFVVSILPVTIGMVLLWAAGIRHPAAAHPAAWSGAGLLGGCAIALLLSVGLADLVMFGLAGAICGLIAWSFAGRPH